MADNLDISVSSGTETIAADDISSKKYQRIKLIHGADGTNDGDVCTAAPLPVNSMLSTQYIQNGTTQCTPAFAAINITGSGDTTLVSAVTSKKIRVLALAMSSAGTTNVKFQSGASGTDLTKLFYLVANTHIELPFNPLGWFESASGVLLNANTSGAVVVGGCLVYVTI